MEPLKIDVVHPGMYYAGFYAAAVVLTFILLTREALKQRYPILPWWLVLVTSFLFFVIGTQLIRFGFAEWSALLRFEPLTISPGRSVLGGLLFGIPALLVACYMLKFRHGVLDACGWVMPLGFAIQRIGCFISGCCYGDLTNVPWAVQYNQTAPAFHFHVAQ